jgi:anti-sigma factor RsiW
MSDDNCQKYRPLLDAYHDGELTSDERLEVERHLDSCEICRGGMNDIQKVVASLKAMPQLSAKKDFALDIEKAILASANATKPSGASSEAASPKGNAVFFKPAVWASLGVAAAVALLLVAIRPAANNQPVTTADKTPALVEPRVTKEDTPVEKPLVAEQINVNAKHQSALPKEPKAVIASKPVPRVPYKESNQAVVAQKPAEENITAASVPSVLPVSAKNSLLALEDNDQANITEELGITTNEDGLYAIKL